MTEGLPTPLAEPAPPDGGSGFVPGWVRGATNLFAMLVTAVLVGVALFLVAWLAPVLAPLGLGLFLAALAAPLFTWLVERGLRAALALTLTIGLLVVLGAGLVVLALAGAAALTESLAAYSEQLQAFYAGTAAGSAGPVPATFRDLVPPELLLSILRTVIAIVIQVGGQLAFAIVIAALLLLDGRRLTRLVSSGLGSGNPVFRETPALARAAITYFVVRLRVNLVTAGSLLVLMLVLGVDHALLWAVGAFFLSFVPYLGLAVALIAPTILAFAESGPLAAGILVAGGIALNLLAENVLEPTLTGRALSLTTWLVFLMFFFWVWLIGPVGALLSMPITVLVVLTLQHNESTRWMAALLTRGEADG
jgi:predicted PurR-regulated permease PerM